MPQLWSLGEDSDLFPPTSGALTEPDGLLAVGGDLSPERLLAAYKRGIFPWYEDGQPILWWSPDPRMVVTPDRVHCSSSLRKFLRKSDWRITVDRAFEAVIEACAGHRAKARGTWITREMQQAYLRLHELGFAHSIEVYDDSCLIGGLYGIGLGKAFFGESMFSHRSNASKTAFISAARWLDREGFALIDCQVANPHLESLGAFEIGRNSFEQMLSKCTTFSQVTSMQVVWQQARGKVISRDGRIIT